MIEEAMSTTPIVFLLIILLFGFDSTGQVTGNTITAKEKAGVRRFVQEI